MGRIIVVDIEPDPEPPVAKPENVYAEILIQDTNGVFQMQLLRNYNENLIGS